MQIRVKAFYYLLGVIFLHYFLGWMVPVIFTACCAGFMLENHHVSKASLIGLLVNGAGVLYTYSVYPDGTYRMTMTIDNLISNLSPYVIPVISVGLPVVLYALAAYVSSNMVYLYRKLNADEPYKDSPYQMNQTEGRY